MKSIFLHSFYYFRDNLPRYLVLVFIGQIIGNLLFWHIPTFVEFCAFSFYNTLLLFFLDMIRISYISLKRVNAAAEFSLYLLSLSACIDLNNLDKRNDGDEYKPATLWLYEKHTFEDFTNSNRPLALEEWFNAAEIQKIRESGFIDYNHTMLKTWMEDNMQKARNEMEELTRLHNLLQNELALAKSNSEEKTNE